MDTSKDQPHMTAGLDLADKYSYLCASSTSTVARLWRKVGCAPPQRDLQATLRLRAASYAHRNRVEAGTHFPWASRVL
jgi:hypothetical protein